VRAVVARPWLALAALLTSACALTGYDFGDYRGATGNREPSAAAGAGGESEAGSGGSEPTGPLVTTAFGVGGESLGTAGAGESVGGAGTAGAAQNVGGACEPRGCFEQGLVCGPADDGCGQPLDCGGCFWWFQQCRQNRCEIPE
jgi:hypothetical protein